jgi:hypothetical protein
MDNQHLHACSCGEILEKTSDEGDNWRKCYECVKCGKMWRVKKQVSFPKQELIIKNEKGL